jgi:hypothetical protein
MVAALFVEKGGVYFGRDDVDPWDEERDARKYEGPWPVVAHPPCARWCAMAPVNQARYGQRIGDDGGCFESALMDVRRWGGVLEHPANSLAWRAFHLLEPPSRGWCQGVGMNSAAWVCQVWQRQYGHQAKKRTWLYYVGAVPPPSLRWGPGKKPTAWISTDRPRAELAAMGIDQLSKKEAKATPPAFAELLLSIARPASAERTRL